MGEYFGDCESCETWFLPWQTFAVVSRGDDWDPRSKIIFVHYSERADKDDEINVLVIQPEEEGIGAVEFIYNPDGVLIKSPPMDDSGKESDVLGDYFWNLLANLSYKLDSKDKTIRRVPAPGVKRTLRDFKDPVKWIYKVTSPVKFKISTESQEDTEPKPGKSLEIQYKVRGHWRNQPCGPGGKDRKRIFIREHWKGPSDAPIALRPHLM